LISDRRLNLSRRAPALRLGASDNVVVARVDLTAGRELTEERLVCRADIPIGHKIATRAVATGEPIVKYGQVIGFAKEPIQPGDHVHLHNCEMGRLSLSHDFCAGRRPTDYVAEGERATFLGIRRADGRVATRNFIGILTTVNCSATVARSVADRFKGEALAPYRNVDGVAAFTHSSGCGMDNGGEGMRLLQRTIAGYARHPNFAGLLVIGLGCEGNQAHALAEKWGLSPGPLLRMLTIQETGGTRATIERATDMVREMLPHANRVERTRLPASELTLALQCGGSDGYSGITANPALGAAVDLLVRHGGTAILSETPEIYGAEHLLTRRAESPEVAEKLLARLRFWEDYTARNHGEMNNNPSPGNKAGGITTILEKSLGAAAKGGSTNLVDVYEYAETITQKGFVFMDSPGYDPCSATGQVASGANVMCFTTGRGSVFGCRPVPSIKLATNTPVFERLREDMDINCGSIADGDADVQEMGRRIFELVLETASGKPSKSEELGFGENEFVPWQIGAVM
jgi:altronate hydrolase